MKLFPSVSDFSLWELSLYFPFIQGKKIHVKGKLQPLQTEDHWSDDDMVIDYHPVIRDWRCWSFEGSTKSLKLKGVNWLPWTGDALWRAHVFLKGINCRGKDNSGPKATELHPREPISDMKQWFGASGIFVRQGTCRARDPSRMVLEVGSYAKILLKPFRSNAAFE